MEKPVTDPVITPPAEEREALTTEPVREEKEVPVADDVDADAAKNVYKLLSDPKTAPHILGALAKQHGLTLGETPKEMAKAEKTLAQEIEDELGPELSFLSGKLSKALEKAFAQREAQFNEKIQSIAVKQAEKEAEQAFSWLESQFSDAKELEPTIVALMDEIPAKGDTRQYLKRLYSIAKSEKQEVSASKALATKIRSSAADPEKILRESKPSSTPSGAGKPIPLDEALQIAVQKLKAS